MVDFKRFIGLRKINSLLIIILILMLLNHAVLSVLYLFGIISYSPNFQITGRRLFYVVILHAIISLYLFSNDNLKRRKIRLYPKLISQTNQQIISGIFILIFMTFHIVNYSASPINQNTEFLIKLTHYIVDSLLFISIAIHLRISIPKLLISFGFLTSKSAHKKIQRKTNIILGFSLIIFMLAEFLFNWVF